MFFFLFFIQKWENDPLICVCVTLMFLCVCVYLYVKPQHTNL